MSQIFISHVAEDGKAAVALAAALEAAGYTTWYYERNSVPGPTYLKVLADALEACQAVLLLASPRSIDSLEVSREVESAHQDQKAIIPVLLKITHAELRERQPAWRHALGATTSIELPPEGIPAIVPKLLEGLQYLGIEPSASGAELPPPLPSFSLVPQPSQYFTGREAQVTELLQQLSAHRLITLIGPPGIGKTQLACATAHRALAAGDFRNSAVFVDLQGASDANAVLTATISAFGLDMVADARELAAQIFARDCLVIFDNIETPLRGDRTGVRTFFTDLLAHTSAPRYLITSRERLGLTEEYRFAVDPLDRDTSFALFRRLSANKGYQWQDGDDDRLTWLLGEWENLPLAIVLAAERLPDDQLLSKMVERWKKRKTAILKLGLEESTPLTDLDYSIGLSFMSLPERGLARQLFGIFAWLPAGATEELLSCLHDDEWEDAMTQVIRSSLLNIRHDRWQMLAPVRAFASRLAWESRDADYERIQHYFLSLAESNSRVIGHDGSQAALALLTADLPNIHAFFDQAIDRSAHAIIVKFALSLRTFYSWRGAGLDGKKRLAAAIASACAMADRLGEAECLKGLGDVHYMLDEYADALDCYTRALPIFRELQVRNGEAECILRLGNIAYTNDDYDAARGYFTEAIPIYQALHDRSGEAICIRSLGNVCYMLDEYPAAREHYEASLPICRELGDRLNSAKCIKQLGNVHSMQADYPAAIACYQEALPIYRELGDRLSEADCQKSLGDVHQLQHRYEQAQACYEEALPIYQEFNDRLSAANCIKAFGNMFYMLDKFPDAREQFQSAITIYQEIGDQLGEANCLNSLGDIQRKTKEYDAAQGLYYDALRIYREIEARLGEASCLQNLGALYREMTEFQAAQAHFEEALAIYREIGFRHGEAETMRELGRLEGATGHDDSCIDYLRKSADLFNEIDLQDEAAKVLDELASLAGINQPVS